MTTAHNTDHVLQGTPLRLPETRVDAVGIEGELRVGHAQLLGDRNLPAARGENCPDVSVYPKATDEACLLRRSEIDGKQYQKQYQIAIGTRQLVQEGQRESEAISPRQDMVVAPPATESGTTSRSSRRVSLAGRCLAFQLCPACRARQAGDEDGVSPLSLPRLHFASSPSPVSAGTIDGTGNRAP